MVGRLKLLVLLLFASGVAIVGLLPDARVVHSQDANGNGIADRVEQPGTQPNTVLPAAGADFDIDAQIRPATECMGCHNTLGVASHPFPAWGGSMMANSARDPVFWAQLDVAEADEAADANLVGARDLCLRCHIPKGWLEGRSSGGPQHADKLRGMGMQQDDLFGVQCAHCHRLVDRDAAALDAVDLNMTNGLNTNPDAELRTPPTYGNGMYVVDRVDVRRGPFTSSQIGWPGLAAQFVTNAADWPPPAADTHPVKHSAFHRSSNLCGTCHDVSNPAQSPAQPKGNTQANFPIERTWTEWRHSEYPARGENGSCQSCHMSGALNGVIAGGASNIAADETLHLNDVHVHDFTGGNVWIPKVISETVTRFQATKTNPDPGPNPAIGATQAERDAFLSTNFARALKALYPAGTYWDVAGGQPPPPGFQAGNYDAASDRARATLRRAAELSATRAPGGDLKVRVWNMTGHKLPTGYPEGRRMWLDVRFLDVNPAGGAEALDAQSGEYNAATGELFHDFNLNDAPGPRAYDVVTYTNGSGGAAATPGRRTQVYEARMHHTPSGIEFHFIRNNERVSDNRIPPLGWVKAQYQTDNAEQVVAPAYAATQMVYHDSVSGPVAVPPVVEPTYNFDEVPYPVPGSSDVAEVRLQYQSVSREYVEELVAASPRTLLYPAGGGPEAFSRGDLLDFAWRNFTLDGATRFPPVEMERLRVALVDTDGDGLSDDWETARGLNPMSPDGDDGRNGDPDGDGRSNYLEFQENTPANVADAPRDPVDLVLVLDFSGSMNEPAPVGGAPKVEVLKDAVELFLKTWKQYAVRPDRIGVVYFSSTVAVESGGLIDFATLPPGTTIETKINELIAAVRARAAGGSTAMGGGLQSALNILQLGAPNRRRQVILFTNGMQNYSPMVRGDIGLNNYRIVAEPVSFANGVYGDSGVTADPAAPFGTELHTLDVRVHTIGVGVAETADDRWLFLLQDIAANTSGPSTPATSQFISRASELEGAFLNNLVASMRGFSPQMLSEQRGRLEAGAESRELDFTLDAAATKATFLLSWSGAALPGRLEYELIAPDGSPAPPDVQVTNGPNYQLATCFVPMARADGRPVGHAGNWKMIVRRGGAAGATRPNENRKADWRDPADYRAYLIADIPAMNYDVRFGRQTYRAGEDVTLHVTLTDSSLQVRTLGKVTAEVARASASFGSLISKRRVDPAEVERKFNATDDRPADRAEAKFRLALLDTNFADSLRPARDTVELFDDGNAAHGDTLAGDGVYSANLGRARVPGLMTADVSLTGKSARLRDFSRNYHISTLVRLAPFEQGSSDIAASRLGSRDDKWVVGVTVKPIDKNGNYLGPGYRDWLKFDVPGHPADSGIADNLDGSYTKNFLLPSSALGAEVRVALGQELIHQGTMRRAFIAGWLWLIWLLLILLILLLLFFIWKWWRRRAAAAGA